MAHPLNRNLDAWWLALPSGNSGFGTSQWDSIARNRLTADLQGTTADVAWMNTPYRSGLHYGNVGFDGTNDTFVTPSVKGLLDWVGNITVSFWAYRRQTGQAAPVSKFLTTGDNRCWFISLGFNAFDVVVYTDGTNGSSQTYAPTSGAAFETWQHFAIVKTGGTLDFYVDGFLEDTITSTADAFAGTAPVAIGSRGDLDNYYNCIMDEICFWSRALDSGEVQQVYLESLNGNPKRIGFTTRLHFNSAAGETGAVTEGVEVSDQYVPLIGRVGSIDETVVLSDTYLAKIDVVASTLDAVVLSDLMAAVIDVDAALLDVVVVSDTYAAVLDVDAAITDVVVLSDTFVGVTAGETGLVTEGVVLTDTMAPLLAAKASSDDIVVVADEYDNVVQLQAALTDKAVASDIYAAQLDVDASLSEVAVMGDSFTFPTVVVTAHHHVVLGASGEHHLVYGSPLP